MKGKVAETLQSRKFWVTVLISGLALGLFMTGQIDVDKMVEIIRWAAGVYVGGLSLIDGFKQAAPLLKDLTGQES